MNQFHNKPFFFALFLLIQTITISAQNNLVEPEFVCYLEGQVVSDIPGGWAGPIGPEGIVFIGDLLYVTNGLTESISIYKDFKLLDRMKIESFACITGANLLLSDEQSLMGRTSVDNTFGYWNIVNQELKYKVNIINIIDRNLLRRNFFYLSEHFFFNYLKNGDLICIPNPRESIDYLLNEDILDYFSTLTEEQRDDLEIDSSFRIFENGELLNIDYVSYITYWMEYYNVSSIENFRNDSRHYAIPPLGDDRSDISYIGKDQNGNVYWSVLKQIVYIFDDVGQCIEKIQYSPRSYNPAVHPNGDVYIIRYGEGDIAALYRIDNTWDPIGE